MAQTYDQHKADVDREFPAPGVIWQILEPFVDEHHYHEFAQFVTQFNDEHYEFFAYAQRQGDGTVSFGVGKRVAARDSSSRLGRETVVSGALDWTAGRAAFATYWEGWCEDIRHRIVTRRFALDLADDSGAVQVVQDNAIPLTISAAAGTTYPLIPSFDPDVFAYTGTTAELTLQLNVVLRPGAMQVVRWIFGETVSGQLSTRFDLVLGRNEVNLEVYAHNGYTKTVYTIIITRT